VLLAGTSTVTIPYVTSNAYTFVFASSGQTVTQRKLREAAIVNAAGRAVLPTTDSTAAAITEADTTNLRAIWSACSLVIALPSSPLNLKFLG
jgi:hypothetical protein